MAFAVRLVVKPFAFVLGAIFPYLNTVCALVTLFVHVARIKSIFEYFNIFDVLEVKLADHLLELDDLFFRPGIILLEVAGSNCLHLMLF